MSYHLTIKDIQKQTGLKESFIRRCVSTMKDAFELHMSRGDNNTLLFDDNVYLLFDRIKQLKEKDNLTLPEIEKQLSYNPAKPDNKADNLSYQNLSNGAVKPAEPDETYTSKALFDMVLKEKERLLEEKDKAYQTQLNAKETIINGLQSNLKLLTDGRSPETVKKEWEENHKKQLERKEIVVKLEELEGRWFKSKERQELLALLKELS